jgi:hypothetical protein
MPIINKGNTKRGVSPQGEEWYDKLFNMKYLPLFHHFKAIYQFPKHVIFLVKIVANASLNRDKYLTFVSLIFFMGNFVLWK